jgi:hypothetical protein
MLSTHDKLFFEAMPVQKLHDVREYLDEFDVIAIDEGQFYPDVRRALSLPHPMRVARPHVGSPCRRRLVAPPSSRSGTESCDVLTSVCSRDA